MHIQHASRPMSPREAGACEASGVRFVELAVATDAIVMFTAPTNEGVGCLSLEQFYALVGPEATGTGRWSEANAMARMLGAPSEPPDIPFRLVGPGRESGTRAMLIQLTVAPIAGRRTRLSARMLALRDELGTARLL